YRHTRQNEMPYIISWEKPRWIQHQIGSLIETTELLLHWPEVKNILDLLVVMHIRFEALQVFKKPGIDLPIDLIYQRESDKSTPNRISNQAGTVCPMVTGRRKAIVVSAPEVYESAESGIDGDVSGAHAPELATTIYQNITGAYPRFITPRSMDGNCV
ncbi:Hypothetical predicted protein, partial [Paramuricea clavata]